MFSLFLAAALVQSAPANPIQAAAQAFGGCLQGKVASVPASLTPEAGADDIMKQCEAQRASKASSQVPRPKRRRWRASS